MHLVNIGCYVSYQRDSQLCAHAVRIFHHGESCFRSIFIFLPILLSCLTVHRLIDFFFQYFSIFFSAMSRLQCSKTRAKTRQSLDPCQPSNPMDTVTKTPQSRQFYPTNNKKEQAMAMFPKVFFSLRERSKWITF